MAVDKWKILFENICPIQIPGLSTLIHILIAFMKWGLA